MSPMNCEHVRDLLPELISGQLDAVVANSARDHVAACAECRAELAIATSIAQSQFAVPVALEQRVRSAAANRRVSYWSRGRMAAVATFAVAIIGGSVLVAPYLDTMTPPPIPTVVNNVEVGGAGFISVEDAFGSGAASLGDLTEEELKQLLAELDS